MHTYQHTGDQRYLQECGEDIEHQSRQNKVDASVTHAETYAVNDGISKPKRLCASVNTRDWLPSRTFQAGPMTSWTIPDHLWMSKVQNSCKPNLAIASTLNLRHPRMILELSTLSPADAQNIHQPFMLA